MRYSVPWAYVNGAGAGAPDLPRDAVAYDGKRQGETPLAWGQQYIRNIIRTLAPNDEHLNLAYALEIPQRCTIDDVVRVVAWAMEQFDTLRTHYDGDVDSEVQLLHASGSVPLPSWDVDPEDAANASQVLLKAMAANPFDVRNGPVVRWGLTLRAGAPHRLLVVLSHMTMDGIGAGIFNQALTRALELRVSGAVLEQSTQWQPLDQVAFEQSSRGAAVAEASRAYWRRELRRHRSCDAGARYSGEDLPYWNGVLDSSRTVNAVAKMARATGMRENSILVAVFARVLADVMGRSDVPMNIRTANRVPGASASMVGHLSQATFVWFDGCDDDLATYLKSSNGRVLSSYRYGRYRPRDLDEALSEVTDRDGTGVDMGFTLNSLRPAAHDYADASITPTSFEWFDKREQENVKAFITALRGSRISLMADTRWLSPADIQQVLLSVEHLLEGAKNIGATPVRH